MIQVHCLGLGFSTLEVRHCKCGRHWHWHWQILVALKSIFWHKALTRMASNSSSHPHASSSSLSSEEGSSTSSPSSFPSISNSPAEGESDSRIYERWRRAFGVVTGVGLTAEQRADALADQQRRTCEKWKQELTKYSQCPLHPLSFS